MPTSFSRLLMHWCMRLGALPSTLLLACTGLLACAGLPAALAGDAAPPASALEARSGGATTVATSTRDAFTLPAANISDAHRRDFMIGQSVFNQNWVAAPSSNRDRQGLGPLFNAPSCSTCHTKAGRGAPPGPDDPEAAGLLLRLSVPGTDEHGGPRGEPTYGGQFHPFAISGVESDGAFTIDYREEPGRFADGVPFSLRRPSYRFTRLSYGALQGDALVSPRVAPQLCGLGLLEMVAEDEIKAIASAQGGDVDGVRGHVNTVWDVRRGAMVLGRFGWKAGQPTLEQQDAGAFSGDIGITSSLFPAENTPLNHALAVARPSGGEAGRPELSELRLQRLSAWSHLIAVPDRRGADDAVVRHGEDAFLRLRCSSCHLPSMTTGACPEFPELARQTIHPYSDLLLHDLGDGLADGRPDYAAGARDWRTPPLWGIGLIETVNGHHLLLHDGRARDANEAILWHGGEAAASRARYLAADAPTRAALLAFLASL
jgi:CxxC motif-containing protein (DUF1111 family)